MLVVTMSTETRYPTADEIRLALVGRADEFCRITGSTRTKVGLGAINDGAFVSRVEKGHNFRIQSYERVMSWLDAQWPETRAAS